MTVIVDEEELLAKEYIRAEDVHQLSHPTRGFLCPRPRHDAAVRWSRYTVDHPQTGRVMLDTGERLFTSPYQSDPESWRQFKYVVPSHFLRLRSLKAAMYFTIGDAFVDDLRLIERVFYRRQLLMAFDFSFGSCRPFTTKRCALDYTIPLLTDELIEEMKASPFQTVCEGFFFCDDVLFMHAKSSFKFI
ncbi:hypothetical protein AAG570_008380 [Ranatra chinensis]|uniref:GMP phosphodiesterase delta subunit domain-containing protein n=1 Tax=Ranatra chinensis TaxID=642074 RepID=A0ABD0XT46_9HEMI